MNEITEYLATDHDACDNLFSAAENAVAAGDWELAAARFAHFREANLRHFAREEDVLFPEFEALTGMTGGPTSVMRNEHDQMRASLDEMAAAIVKRDSPAYLGQSETLLMLMRQHNLKEERILYPMADQALPDGGEVVRRMAQMGGQGD